MRLPLQGGRQCGRLRYEIRAEPLSVYVCHCTECQRQSGSAFAMSAVVSRAALAYVSGHPRQWSRRTDRGTSMDGDFCADCGCRIAHYPSANETVAVVKPGTLDDTTWLVPVGHIWTRSAQPWVPIPADGVNYEGHPDVARLIEAWRHRHPPR